VAHGSGDERAAVLRVLLKPTAGAAGEAHASSVYVRSGHEKVLLLSLEPPMVLVIVTKQQLSTSQSLFLCTPDLNAPQAANDI